MTATDSLRVLADWNRNTLYDHALSDISGRVLSAQWSFGYNAPDQLIAPPAGGTVVLDNSDGAFNVHRGTGAYTALLKRGVMIKFQHAIGPSGAGWTHAVLRISDIAIAPGMFGNRTVVLTLTDWNDELFSALYDPPLTLNTNTGLAILDAVSTGAIAMPYASSWAMLDASSLDVDAVLFDRRLATFSFMGPGSTTLDYVGDNIDKGNGTSLYAFIEEMCAAEMGGRFMFRTNRTYNSPAYWYIGRQDMANYFRTGVYGPTIEPAISVGAFTDTGAEYEYSRTLINDLSVTMYPRRAGSAGTELARTQSPVSIPGLGSRTFTLRYRDPDFPDGTCAATTIIQPIATTDYTGNLASDGSGADYTSNLVVTVVNKTNAAEVTVANTALGTVYLTLLKIRGTPLTARQPLALSSTDAQSAYDYGFQRRAFTIAGVNDTELVQQYADYYVSTHKDPLARYRRVTFNFPETAADPMYAIVFTWELSTLRILDEWLEDPDSAFPQWIAGETHIVDAQARAWQTTYYLEDYIRQAFGKFDDPVLGILDVSTRLAF
jgi:hypothetical protein